MSSIYNREFSAQSVTLQNMDRDTFNTIGMFEKTTLIELKSINGLNNLRNNFICTGSGNITIEKNEYKLNVTNSGDNVGLESKEKGVYIAGKSSSIGIAVRIPTQLVGDQCIKWGYFNKSDGFYFKKTNTDFFVCILRDNVELAIPRSEFNIDKVDGSGGSSKNLNFSDGNIYRIKFSWYGYGCIEFGIIGKDYFNITKFLPIHTYQTIGHTSILNPSLPINVTLDNGTTNSNDYSIYVAGRSYNIMGSYLPKYRYNGVNVQNINCNNVLKPILSIRKKNMNDFYSVKIIPSTLHFKVDNDIYIEIRSNPILTNFQYNNLVSCETAIEYDTVGDSITSGLILWCAIISSTTNSITIPDSILIDNCSVCIKSINLNANLSYLHLNWKEEW
jgi:hypothetical protein